ncbi:MAG: H(+)/Cl(-) exchange transporter ClcA [Cereibacter sphaeroides]|uniref:H(+)/Cl(-) exchange transporter ClcA n=1 Tax=Cereibacter sphaeroides TaxID=1063 RepID=A0A2W5S614_CERSP|nr:MAG: H(+)/Cl(-) exchange transporter ClcA [Cereibacter sphaeroides]
MMLAVLTGVFAGLIGSLFHLAINKAVTWPTLISGRLDGWAAVAAIAVVTMICTVLAAVLVRRFAPEAGGSGVQEIEGAMEGLREVRWWRVLPVKFFAGIIAIGSGLVLGREGPTIHIGASVGAAVSGSFKTNELERRGLLAGGAAAGLATAFNAPLSGVLFIVEETHREFSFTFRSYLGVAIAAISATIVTQIIGGPRPDLPLLTNAVPLSLLPAFLALGIVLGVLGTVLNASIMWAVDFSARSHARAPFVYPALVGLAVGALFATLPQSVTGGENVILQLAVHSPGVTILLLLATLRFFTMVASYSTGVPGGIFAPILSLAMCVGMAFGECMRLWLPDSDVVPMAFGIAAMGGLFTASVRAPIVGVVLTLELTGSYGLALPLMMTCVAADLVAQWTGGKPIYVQLLDRTLAQAGIKHPAEPKEPIGLG